MNRYKSRQRWRKVRAGCYESPDGRWQAQQTGNVWNMTEQNGRTLDRGTFLTLTDCQEHADSLQAHRQQLQRAAWWGYVQGAKAQAESGRSC